MRERVLKAFEEAFDVPADIDTATLVYRDYEPWTSIGHMMLVAALEAEFDIMMETDDILAMSDFEKAVAMMEKYASA